MPFRVMKAVSLPLETMALPNDGWAGPDHARNLAQPLDLCVVVGDPADLPHVYMRR